MQLLCGSADQRPTGKAGRGLQALGATPSVSPSVRKQKGQIPNPLRARLGTDALSVQFFAWFKLTN